MSAVRMKYFTGQMPLRQGTYAPVEKQAKEMAGGVGVHDNQPWIPRSNAPIVYPERKNRPTKIPLEFNWDEFKPQRCYPVCRHTPDQCPTKPQYPTAASSWTHSWVRAAEPEGHRLPEGMRLRGAGQVINRMSFDEDRPWLDSSPLEVQAKAGYTNFSNDHDALVNAEKRGHFKTDDRGRWHRVGWGPDEYWQREDRKHRKAGVPKLCTSDASKPPSEPKDSLASLRGRQCKGCPDRVPEEAPTKDRYCSERCRNRSEYLSRSDQVGTVSPGIELSSFAVDRKRFGIDVDGDRRFYRLLAV